MYTQIAGRLPRTKELIDKLVGAIKIQDSPQAKLMLALNATLDFRGMVDVTLIEHYTHNEIQITYNDNTTKSILL